MYRYHNNPTLWQHLVEHVIIVAGAMPNWKMLGTAFQDAWAAHKSHGTTVFGGRYIPPVLVKYMDTHTNTWKPAKGLSQAARDALAYQLLWEAAPVRALQEYETSESHARRTAYTNVFRQFRENTAATMQGVVGDYLHNCILDLLFTAHWMHESDITIWPSNCPGYLATLKILFPGLPRSKDAMDTLFFIFREACRCQGKRRLLFPGVMALLCWWI
jgi:hypothetical protein